MDSLPGLPQALATFRSWVWSPRGGGADTTDVAQGQFTGEPETHSIAERDAADV